MAISLTFTVLFASSLMHSLQEQKTDSIAFVFLLRSHAIHKGSFRAQARRKPQEIVVLVRSY